MKALANIHSFQSIRLEAITGMKLKIVMVFITLGILLISKF